jgi:hypothetical protein
MGTWGKCCLERTYLVVTTDPVSKGGQVNDTETEEEGGKKKKEKEKEKESN